jgi:hypothetical protein
MFQGNKETGKCLGKGKVLQGQNYRGNLSLLNAKNHREIGISIQHTDCWRKAMK